MCSLGFGLALTASLALNAAETIYPDAVTPAARYSDAPNWELGTVFRTTVPGKITHVRVFSLAEESGDHQVRIWRNADNTLVAGPITWSFGGDEAWLSLDIPDVPLEANTDYTISVSVGTDGWYPANSEYFGAAGDNDGHLAYPQAAGVFSDTSGNRPSQSFGNTAYLRDVGFEPDLSGAVMKVKGNSTDIADGDLTPSPSDDTQFGGVDVASGVRERTFTISNTGQANLELSGNPKVAVSGANAGDFTVTTQPTSPVPPGGSTTFTLRLVPSGSGLRDAMVSITNSASPGNTYDFAVQGLGLATGNRVLGNNSEGTFRQIINGDYLNGNRSQALRNMRITALRAKVAALTGQFKCAVYSDAEGSADRLLGSTAAVINPTADWQTFTLTQPLDVVAGSFYWLVIWSDTADAGVYADTGTHRYANYVYGNWPDPVSLTGTGGAAFCLYAEGTPLGVTGPEMDMQGNGKPIADDAASPSQANGTDLGGKTLGSGTRVQTFTILNVGNASLALSGTPRATVVGPQASDFVVTAQPAASVPAGGSTTFKVRFAPSGGGFRAATIGILNNGVDPDKNPYQFKVQGAGQVTGRESLWPDSKVGADVSDDGVYYQLGTIFQSSVAGAVTHLRVFSVNGDYGNHTAYLWRTSDQAVVGGPYTWNFGHVTGWIYFDIPPVNIDAATDYTVSISTGTGPHRDYANIAADVPVAGNNGLHLSYPADAGVFNENLADTMPFKSWNHSSYLRDVVFVPAGSTATFPNLAVQGNNLLIPDGFSSPTGTNNTDFGPAAVGGGTADRTFVITNTGTAPLNLSATPKVAITSPQAGDFTVLAQPASPIPPGGSSELTIRFAPAATGARRALVSIENNDKNPFYFSIAGTGTAAQVRPRIVSLTPNLTTGDVTLGWQDGGPQFQVEKATTVTGQFQPLSPVQSERTFTDPGVLKTNTQNFYRVRQL